MKKLLSVLSLVALVSIGAVSTSSFAEDLPDASVTTVETVTDGANTTVETTTVETTSEVVTEDAAAPAEAAEAPATLDSGSTSWMIMATVLVLLMIIPGLALFYGGLVRAKNMLSVLMQVFAITAMVSVIWVVYGYSLAFTDGGSLNGYIG